MSGKRSKVQHIGINDSDEIVGKRINGKMKQCPIYVTWCNMLKRCYSSLTQEKQPSYKGCSVCDEWLVFSNFKKWMEEQDWEGKFLDKDLLFPGNKIYSPETCILVSRGVNNFLTSRSRDRGSFPLGVSWHSPSKKFCAYVSNPFLSKQEHLGLFNTAEEAHAAWLSRKKEIAKELAAQQEDGRVAAALLNIF